MNRREFLYASSALLASPSVAANHPIPAIQEYERRTGGHIGVYARNIRTGAKLSWRADERFVMCSTFKASLAGCVLSRVDLGKDSLESPVRYGPSDILGEDWWAPAAKENLAKGTMSVSDMCAAAVQLSDNTCANVLLARIGGPSVLTAYWRQLGDEVTRLDANEPSLNRTPMGKIENTTTPAAMVNNLHRLTMGSALSEQSKALLVGWLIGSQTGFNRLRAGLPKAWRVGDKTGNNGADAAGDLAVIWPEANSAIVAGVYTRGGTPTAEQFSAIFADLGKEIANRLYTG